MKKIFKLLIEYKNTINWKLFLIIFSLIGFICLAINLPTNPKFHNILLYFGFVFAALFTGFVDFLQKRNKKNDQKNS